MEISSKEIIDFHDSSFIAKFIEMVRLFLAEGALAFLVNMIS